MQIEPVRSLQGQVGLPGDKSISHRYAILAAMAEGQTEIRNYSSSQDCQSTLNCLSQLGVESERRGNEIRVSSRGWRSFRAPASELDAGNSGTTIRLLSGVLAACPFRSTIAGDHSLNRRPMRRIMVPLTRMGAAIAARDEQYPPLTIQGARLQGIRYQPEVASAQVKSCILLAGLMAKGITTVIEEVPSRDHTERALPHFGVRVERNGAEISLSGQADLKSVPIEVPGDFSAAVFFILAALMVPDSDLVLNGVGINPSRSGLLDLLQSAGAGIQLLNQRELQGEPVCDLRVRFNPAVLSGFPEEIAGQWIPNVIDEIPALAVFGTQLEKGLRIRNAEELRKKESDRIAAVVSNLQNLGIEVEEFHDGLSIAPGQTVRGGLVQCYGDHRIAMAFGTAGLIADSAVELDDPECCAVSFPDFFQELEGVTRR